LIYKKIATGIATKKGKQITIHVKSLLFLLLVVFCLTQSTPGGCGNEKKNPGDLPAPAPKRE
jgi:hypothetical protein